METCQAFRVVAMCLLLTATPTLMAQQPLCDVTCTPDPSSPSYGGALAARPHPLNARGSLNPKAPRWRDPSWGNVTMSALPGSESYNYTIPILHLTGRAGLDLSLALYYNSRIWDIDTVGGTATFNADRDFPSYGFRLDFGYVEYDQNNDQYILTEADGTKRALPNGPWGYTSTDGSFITYNTVNNTLVYKNGLLVQYSVFPSQSGQTVKTLFRPVGIRDTNGNWIFISYVSSTDQLLASVTDTVGRTINFNYYPNTHLLQSLTQNVFPTTNDPSGVHTYATFIWGTKYGAGIHWHNFTGLSVLGAPDFNTALNVITKCTYANGTGYQFTYGDWGIINKIENLASNGTTVRSYVSYLYPPASIALNDAPSYTQQNVSPDGTDNNLSTWNYLATKPSPGVLTSMKITDPLGNIEITNVDQFTGLTSSVQPQDSAGNPLRTTSLAWSMVGPATMLTQITTTLNDSGQHYSIWQSFDNYGNRTNVKEFDYDGTLKRESAITYNASTAYVNNHILDRPIQVLTKNGNGTIVARTDFAYDAYPSPGLLLVAGAPGHDDQNFGTAFLTRGSLTSITHYSNAAAGIGAITSNFNYDTVGNLRLSVPPCCNQNQIQYNFSNGTHYAYPDSVVRGPAAGPQFTTNSTYTVDFGLPVSTTDMNAQVTQFQYDNMMRGTKTILPPQSGTAVEFRTGFADNTQAPSVTSSTANSGTTTQSIITMDGLGHVMQVDTTDGTTAKSRIIYGYDKLWRRTSMSNPFVPGDTVLNTTFIYDALGRTKQIMPPSAGYTQFQYFGNSLTVTDPAGKQRKNFTDALGRLVEVDEPGWGDAVKATGTINITSESGTGGDQWSCLSVINGRCFGKFWDTGSVSLTVNGVTKSVPYGSSDTTTSVAANLASAFHNDGTAPADATSSGATITLTARTAGTVGNSYAVTSSTVTNDPNDFYPGSFFASPVTPTLTGGLDFAAQGSPTLVRPLVTTYSYDVLNNLILSSEAAMQLWNGSPVAGQVRSFVYDGLGRLTQATTPESGTVNTFYTKVDGVTLCAGNPSLACYTTDARNVTKTFSYADPITSVVDPLNRLRAITYAGGPATPSVGFTYDTGGAAAFALGRLTEITEGPNSQTMTHNNLGRTTKVETVIDGAHYVVQYGFNLAGQMNSFTYPSGRVVTSTYDPGMGYLNSIVSNATQYLTINSSDYDATGHIRALTLGNGVQGMFTYNDHLQLSSIRYFKTGNAQDFLNLSYDYGIANNSQIQAIHYYTSAGVEDLTKSEYFTYDPWSRLSAAHTGIVNSTPGTWSLDWTYDRLGNRLTQHLDGGNILIGQPTYVFDPGTNRITSPSGYLYDAAGNMTQNPSGTYAYDGANRLITINSTGASYTYFGSLRLKKVNGSATTVFVYAGGKVIAEYAQGSPVTSPNKEYIYVGSRLLATISGVTTTYHHPDHLSNRSESDGNASLPPARTYGHFPYGETWYETGTADKSKFTTYERDTLSGETGLDYAIARHYESDLAQFMSVDPLGGNLMDPQSLNRYSYAQHDPVNLTDPTGMFTGNFRCLLNDHGDCPTGNYYGYSWMDPMAIWGGMSNNRSGICYMDSQAVDCGMVAAALRLGGIDLGYIPDGEKIINGDEGIQRFVQWTGPSVAFIKPANPEDDDPPDMPALQLIRNGTWVTLSWINLINLLTAGFPPAFNPLPPRTYLSAAPPPPGPPPIRVILIPKWPENTMDRGTAIFCASFGDAELTRDDGLDALHAPEGYGRSEAAVWGYDNSGSVPRSVNLNPGGEARAETAGTAAGGAAVINNLANCGH